LLKASVLLLIAGALGVGCGFGGGDLTLGYLGWDENVANSNLTKVLLEEELGYENVELKLADGVGAVYRDLIEGETDAFLDSWMPNHEQFVEGGRGRIEVSKEPWYVDPTRYGIAVPDYMQDVRSISDLDSSGTDMITGIEPGAVLMKKIETDVVPRYHLRSSLGEATTPAMLAGLEQAYNMEEPFGFLALINAMRLDEDQVGSLELVINETKDPEKGVRRWLEVKEYRELVRPWIEAAKNAQEEQ
jgi:glycine betaine/proline transport system substrate-binding protein